MVDCPERPICRPDALGCHRAYDQQQDEQGSKQGGEEPSGGQDALSFVTVPLLSDLDCRDKRR
jgi:hypothetical protein